MPGGLKAICIIAIILGGLGLLFSCGGALNLVVGQSVQSAFNVPAPAGGDPEMAHVQQELQKQMLAIGQGHVPFRIGAVILHLLAGIMLLLGGILTLKLSAPGRWVLLAGCVVAMLYELAQSVLAVIDQLQAMSAIQKFAEQGFPQGGPADLPPEFGQFMGVFMLVILGFTLVTALIKIGFYIFSVIYLQRPPIVARFAA